MSDKTKLLPCPFCGRDTTIDYDKGRYYVECTGCFYIGKSFLKLEKAIEFWNNRVPSHPVPDMERVKEDLKIVHFALAMDTSEEEMQAFDRLKSILEKQP